MSESPDQPVNPSATGAGLATEKLLLLVYDELRRLAAAKLKHEAQGQTLQPTALVHEAWLRLGGESQPAWQNRAHFMCAAAEAMRRILIDRARSKHAQRHGGGKEKVDIAEVEIAAPMPEDELLAVHDALDLFERQAPEKAQLVKLRYFGGMTLQEGARTLGISEPTAVRWWLYAKTWLYQRISQKGPDSPDRRKPNGRTGQ